MSDYYNSNSDYKSSSDSKPRRSKASNIAMTRTINNNLKPYRRPRRTRGNRMKSVSFTFDFEMTGQPGKDTDKEETPRLSPVSEEKVSRMKPEHQYSREELIELMTHPLSSKKHPCLESPQNKSLVSGRSGVRCLEDRRELRKHTDSVTDEDKDRSDGSHEQQQKKRIADPKTERLRKEQDVVLSPQRRSFNSGCFVNLPPQHASSGSRRPESPMKGERDSSHRELPSRRIGSGRIMRDPMWDYRAVDKDEVPSHGMNSHDYNYRQREERFERRTFERSHEKERPHQRNPRYSNSERRRYEKSEPEEPEWFSSGPTSQHDTIELHGFDGPMDEKSPGNKRQFKNNRNSTKIYRKSTEPTNSKCETPVAKKNSSRKPSPEIVEQQKLEEQPQLQEYETKSSSSPVADKHTESPKKTTTASKDPPASESSEGDFVEEKEESEEQPACVYDIEAILNFDSLPPMLTISNGCMDDGGNGTSGSRFSQFFRRESSSPQQTGKDSRHSSAHEEMFNSMINEITANILIPPDADTYFAPISPAAPSMKEEANKDQSANLLEMLHRGTQNFQGRKITKKPSLKDLEASGKIHSVEELEARLRKEQGIGKPMECANRPSNKEEEFAAFRKLMMLKQLQNVQDTKTSSHSGLTSNFQSQQQPTMNQQQPSMNQQQPSMNQQQPGMNQQQPIMNQQQPSINQQQPSMNQQQMPIPHDLVMKLLHVQQQQRQQQEVFTKLLLPQNRLAPSTQFNVPPPAPPLSPELQMQINNSQPTKELLQRPEAQAVLRSLKRGEISLIHLVEQLKRSTTMQPIHREIIASIIKLHGLHSMPQNITQREPSPASLAPPSTTEQLLHQMLHNQQNQHQQQQLRIPSPHTNPFNQQPVLSPNMAQSSSNTLTVQHPHPVLQRVPSPRELVAHTQSILQNALLKKKLEEQKENYRKRQELHRSLSPNIAASQVTLNPSPIPLFTPTSVLRKMTAEKDSEHTSKIILQQEVPQQLVKQGRAIVKGNSNFSVPPPPLLASNVDYMSLAPQIKVLQRNKLPPSSGTPQQNFMMGVNRNRNNIQPLNSRDSQPIIRGPQQMALAGHNYNMTYQNIQESSHDLSASPVSNQLARWFSPELLAQARAGKLPNMPPISPTQNMLSVEELERLQQAVHN